jgi:hypothetical protein
MKIFLILILIGLSNQEQAPICNKDLLFSYGVSEPKYLKATPMLCGGLEKETCCSHNDETKLLNTWNTHNRTNIKPYLDGTVLLTKSILNYYEDLIVLAKYIYLNPKSKSDCKASAEHLVTNYMYKDEITNFVAKLEKLMNNISILRKGFYCVMCSVKNQKYFDVDAKKIIFSNNFCRNLVESSIEETYYKVNQFLPTLSHINTILNCKDGSKIVEKVDIEVSEEKLGDVNICYNSYKEFKDPLLYLEKCFDFCKNYSLTSASEIFEGKLEKLDYIFKKIVSSGLKCTDPIFPEVNNKMVYKFYKIKSEFFENKLNFQNLEKYDNSFENFGIELFEQSLVGLYFYGAGQSSLEPFIDHELSLKEFSTIINILMTVLFAFYLI